MSCAIWGTPATEAPTRGDYREVGREFAERARVKHGTGVYVDRDDPSIHTNTVEGLALLKRGMKGIYQHCGEAHLHRYLAEFDFRYNHRAAPGVNDAEQAVQALAGARGRRLTYRWPSEIQV